MTAETLTYAIGDIHGCADLLDRLLERIEAHAGERAKSSFSSATTSIAGPTARG